MPSLLNLPLELLTQIVRETIPGDFEATALSCQTLFAASRLFRAQYTTRRKRFRQFTFSQKLDPKDEDDPNSEAVWDELTQETGIRIANTRQLLEYIAEDPTIVDYIHDLDMRGPQDSDEEDEELIESLKAPLPENLRQLVRASPLIDAVGGNPTDWMGGIQISTVDADVFLLTLLPQVRTLALHSRWDDLNPVWSRPSAKVDRLWPVVQLITHRANRPEEFPDASLSKLAILEPTREQGYEEKSPLTTFVPFLAINSVREANLRSCVFKDDGYTGIPFEPTLDTYGANLRKLSFESSIAGPEELSQLLSRLPNLEIFEFSHETKWHGCGYGWNWGAFLDVVQEVCAKSLQQLSVILDTNYGPAGATLQDMTRFKKLAVLKLDIPMLCGPPYDPSMRDEEFTDSDELGSPAYPRLVDLLPASIETFELFLDEFDEKCQQYLPKAIEGLAEARSTKLPNLTDLRLVVNFEITDDARESLIAARDGGFSIFMEGEKNPIL